jgi:hypothetical protein
MLTKESHSARKVELSVMVLIGEKAFGLERFLQSFLETQPTQKLEILFVCPEGVQLPLVQNERFANVVHLCYGSGEYFKVIRRAIETAKAEYVLFQESHTLLKVNIIDAYLQVIRTDRFACIGTLVYPGDELSFTDWVAYLAHYSAWGPGTEGGEGHQNIPGHNCVYRKSALLDLGEQLEVHLYAGSIIQWKFLEKGLRLYLIEQVHVVHDDKMSFGELSSETFWYGWLFAYARRKSKNWHIGRRLLYAFLVFGKPIIRFRLLLRQPLELYRLPRRQTTVILAAVMLNFVCSALGESFGALFSDHVAMKKVSEAH